MKKLLSILMAFVLVFSMLPIQGAAAETTGSTITVSGSSYRSKYVVVSNGTKDGLYYINSSGVIENTDGTAARFAADSYTIYYGVFSSGRTTFASGTATVGSSGANVSATLRSASVGSNTAYSTRERYATASFYNTTAFNHVDLRVAATYEINIGNQSYTATVYNPSVVVKVGSRQVANKSWTGTTSYEWRQDGLKLTKSSVITVELTLDLQYTDSQGKTQKIEDIALVYDSVNDVDKFIEAIAICDSVWGLDFQVGVEEIQEVIEYHTVSYEWKVYNTDGTYTNLPAGAPKAPAATNGHEEGTFYHYDTTYAPGTSFYDYDKGLLYTFQGWKTYSLSSIYNPVASSGYHALESGKAIEIAGDTYIYGYWTVSQLEPSSAHISIEKVFLLEGVEAPVEAAEDLYFRIDTGIDRDGDGNTQIDVDYPMIQSANGEYKIPVYQYDTPFRFTEHNADIPGYTRTTTIRVSGEYITGSTQSGDSVSVSMAPVYQGENVHLGTVTYINSYTKNTGAPVAVYPTLTLLKSAADTRQAQPGVGFTLYSDAACRNAMASVTTGSGGVVTLDFGAIPNVTPGTYYLKETQPLAGYYADPVVYPITLAVAKTAEELREGQFVQVTYYGLSISLPEGSTAAHESGSNRLHIFDAPVLGSLQIAKTIQGLAQADTNRLSAVVIVHGPIRRDSAGSISDLGGTWQLELNSDNGWAASLEDLPLGEYLVHESFASVHGYTWTGVNYSGLDTEVYNNIASGLFRITDETPVLLNLVNTYSQWEAADFYIKKVNDQGAALADAVFTLSTDLAGVNVVATKTTGADGYAHFSGYTVPAGQDSVTYYLRETKAPQGYYLSDQVYQVVISAVTNGAVTTYEPQISLVSGRSTGFDIATDLLTVTNFPVLGQITVNKVFENGFIPEGLTQISLQISGPNDYTRLVTLHQANNWSATLSDLAMGTYTVVELDSSVPGYSWNVTYSGSAVTLAEADPGHTAQNAQISGLVTVTNRYTRNETIYQVPTSLTVKKVDQQGQALAGAVFTLEKLDASGKHVVSTQSFTTGTEGIVMFDLLAGFVQEGNAVAGTYILSETQAPAGYDATDTTWTVTVREDDGQVRWTLNENKNLFEGFWDWVVGNVSAGTFENGVLTVQNSRSKGSLVIEKTVLDPQGLYADTVYTFTLDASDNSFDRTFTLKAGESFTLADIPYGTTYTLTEDATGAAFTSVITDSGNGLIQAEETRILVANTYAYSTHHAPLSLVKVDAADPTQVISGAGFTLFADAALETPVSAEVFSSAQGKLALDIPAAGTYYLAETTAPADYHPNDRVYVVTAEEKAVVLNAGTANAVTQLQLHIRLEGLQGTSTNGIDYTYAIENTAIRHFDVTAQKIWNDGSYHARPASVEVTLFRDNVPYETVTLSQDNGWFYTWKDLTDTYSWSVDEVTVPAGYSKAVENQGYDWVITNTRAPKAVEITVTKTWQHNGGKTLPESVEVTLYRDGQAYEAVTLSGSNNWTHTWTGLTDVSVWSVEETEIPAGYIREIFTEDGFVFTIRNTRIIQPVEVHVTKVWAGNEGVIHPESVDVVLYRDGAAYETVTLSAENQWSYSWTDLTDEFTWHVDEETVPERYTKTVTQEGNRFTITNTREFQRINVSVRKVWNSAGAEHPDSVKVVLYRNGEAYSSVTLDESNNWQHTWKKLTDDYEWTVDEPSVPSGYRKRITGSNYSFTITNTHEDNPKTGGLSDLMGKGAMLAIGVTGFTLSLIALFAPRKKEEQE